MAAEQDASGVAGNTTEQITVDENQVLEDYYDPDIISLSSSIRDHVYENGRRYHSLNAGRYTLPNDEAEQQRLDMFHHANRLLLNGDLHLVQLPQKLDRILDLGTGTGIWAIDMADLHPNAQVIGVDLSPIQPSWVPPNCAFEVDDLEQPWMWKKPFDFIHSANLAQGIRDWPQYVKRIYDNLTPGGVVQLHEVSLCFHTDDDTIPRGGHLERYTQTLLRAAAAAGIEEIVYKLEPYLMEAGFSDVRVVVKKLPLGPWARDAKKKELGKWGLAVIEGGLTSYGVALFTRQLGMSIEESEELCNSAFRELCSRNVHVYAGQWFVEGRKPAE